MGACRPLGPRGPHVDGGGVYLGVPSLVTGHLSGQKVQVDCAGAAAHETLTPRTNLKTFRAVWEKPGRAHRRQRGRQPWVGRGQKAERRPLRLPLIGSPFCPSPPQAVQWPRLPEAPAPGHGTLPLRAPTVPGPWLGCSPGGSLRLRLPVPSALLPCLTLFRTCLHLGAWLCPHLCPTL